MMEEVTGQKSVILGLLDKGKDEKKSEVRQKAEASILATAGDEAIPAIGVTRLITQIVEDFCSSAWPGERIQGLFALRELTFVLEKDRVQCYVQQITKPVLLSFSDEDAQVRYKACEAFYNIAKVMRSGILQDMGAVFDGLCRLYTDVEQNIKEGAQSLDRLVRDIVVEQRHFDYSALIPLITSRIHVLNPSVRQLVLGWIVLLDSLPQVDMIAFLPHYLEGLFGILASDNRDFRLKAQECLENLLSEITRSAAERPERAQRAIAQAATTVARCCRAGGEHRSEDANVRVTALKWLLESVKLQVDLEREPQPGEERSISNRFLMPPRKAEHASEAARASEGGSGSAQGGLRQLVPELLPGALYCLDDGEGTIQQEAEQANAKLREAALNLEGDLPVEPVAGAVISAMSDVGGQERSEEVLLKCFDWAELLLERCPAKVVKPQVRDRLAGSALKVLLRKEDEVVSRALGFMAKLTATGEQQEERGDLLGNMCQQLFRLMKEQPSLLESRGGLIVRKICGGPSQQNHLPRVDVERFFATAAAAVEVEEDKEFARKLVQVLNRGLLTGPETQQFRARLRTEPRETPENSLPMVLMHAWLVCPVSSLALSFWLNWYELAAGLANRLATSLHTEGLKAQLTEFVELLESPVFSDVRLQMLEVRHRSALLRAMLCLGALLPQEKALQGRLQVVETGLLLERVVAQRSDPAPGSCSQQAEQLLAKFEEVCKLHRWKECVV